MSSPSPVAPRPASWYASTTRSVVIALISAPAPNAITSPSHRGSVSLRKRGDEQRADDQRRLAECRPQSRFEHARLPFAGPPPAAGESRTASLSCGASPADFRGQHSSARCRAHGIGSDVSGERADGPWVIKLSNEGDDHAEAQRAQLRDLARRLRRRARPEPRQPARRGRRASARVGVRDPHSAAR